MSLWMGPFWCGALPSKNALTKERKRRALYPVVSRAVERGHLPAESFLDPHAFAGFHKQTILGSIDVPCSYKPHWNREDSEFFGHFVAGSICGGIILYFQNGQVSKIFLGAAAE
jgi:hypothetical protein